MLQNGLFAAVYFAAAKFGLSMAYDQPLVTQVAPASGIALAVLLLFGFGLVPGVVMGSAVVSYEASRSIGIALAVGAGNALEATAGAWVLRRFFRFRGDMMRVSDVLALVIGAAWVCTQIGSIVGATTLFLAGRIRGGEFLVSGARWWLGDAMGVILVAPFILAWSAGANGSWSRRRLIEAMALLAALGMGIWLLFGSRFQIPYVIFPILIWASVRFGMRGATLITVLISGASIWFTTRGFGPFVRDSAESGLMVAQSFIGVVSVTGLILAAALSERQETAKGRAQLAKSLVIQTRMRFLAEASSILESSLDYTKTLDNVTHLLVPDLADCSAIAMVGKDDHLVGLTVAHRDRSQEGALRRLIDFKPKLVKGHPIGEALAFRRAVLVPQVTPEFLNGIATTPEHAQLMSSMRPVSAMVIPMLVPGGDTLLGLLMLGRTEATGIQYKAEDLALAEDLGRRCAGAIWNTEMYAAAKRSVRMREETLAVVSHDLKNPLATIQVGIKLIESLLSRVSLLPLDRDKLRQALSYISVSVERSQRLIQDLLDFAKIEAGTFAVVKRPYYVRSILEEAAAMFRAGAAEKQIDLRVVLLDAPYQVSCDKVRVFQVLSNLIGNALKFTHEGGRVTLAAERHGGEIWFSVADTGPGLSKETLEHLFERYWQPKESRAQGTGLGLSIAKGLVDAHEGRIWAESEPGNGCKFSFSLSLA